MVKWLGYREALPSLSLADCVAANADVLCIVLTGMSHAQEVGPRLMDTP